jgi:manganese-dependent ADP-ribose/CDP-alcohol diphosphatase
MRFAALLALSALALPSAAPAQERPRFSIGAIADAQYTAEPDAPPRLYHTAPAKLAAAVADFNREDLAFVVHLGDFIDRDWTSYDVLLPIAARLRHPWHFVLGNHEFSVDETHKPQVPARLGMKARYYSFEHRGWLFLVTDGNDLSTYAWAKGSAELARGEAVHASLYADRPAWNGGIGPAQLLWLDRQLARADRKRLKAMIFDHFPLWPETRLNLWNAPAVMALLERHPSAKIWLDGHNHEGNYGTRAGIHYVNLKGMVDTPDTAYARLDFYSDRVVFRGFGRQQDLTLPLRRDVPTK